MIIIGVDYHPEFQQIAFLDKDTGEFQEKRLSHPEEAEQFYRVLAATSQKVRVGMEASGHARWFERLLAELQFELWIGDAADIQSKRGRKQKTDRQDAEHILKLLLKDDFPRIWVPNGENRDLRQLLWHRHRLVQARTRIMNQLQAVAIHEGLRCKKRLWRAGGRQQLESFLLAPWASRRRHDLLELLDRLSPTIAELNQAIEQETEKNPEARRLRTHPGVRARTALAFVLIVGNAKRFPCGKQVASYLGLVPLEKSSGNRRRLGSHLRRVSEVKTLADKAGSQKEDSGDSVKPEQRQVGDTVYYFVGEQGPYCQLCFHNKRQLILLSPTREFFGGLGRRCGVCGETFFEKVRKQEHVQVRGSGGPNSWME